MSLVSDERVEELLAKEAAQEAEIAKLRDDLGEALVRENNLRAALEAIEQNCLSVSREPEIEADPVQRLAWKITAKMATAALAGEERG